MALFNQTDFVSLDSALCFWAPEDDEEEDDDDLSSFLSLSRTEDLEDSLSFDLAASSGLRFWKANFFMIMIN